MLDDSLLTAFSSVVREGSFDKAAKRLNLTPSAISQKIKQLETKLGNILLIRGRPCVATEIGYQVFRHAESINLLEKDLLAAIPNAISTAAEAHITLRIAVNADSVASWFTKALAEFSKQYYCLFDLILDDQNHTAEMLRAGKVTAAISANNKPIQGFRNLLIGSLSYTAVANPVFYEHYFSEKGVNIDTLSSSPCISFNRKDMLQHEWIRSTFGCDAYIQSHWLPSSSGYLNASLHGLGWGLNPRLLSQEYLSDESLIELVPNSDIVESLYWQYSTNSGRLMQELTSVIEQVGKAALLQ